MKKFRYIAINLLILGIFVSNLRFLFNAKLNETSAINEQFHGEAMVTIERSSGRILYSKNKDKILPMASTTKIITAIVAIENCDDLDEKHFITKEMTGVEGSSIYLKAGEKLSVRELLYGLMLRSGNDSAVAIAIIIGGSIDNFVKMMNEFCLNLGLLNTNIVTVNGLHNNNHYTTASDLAKITCYALSNNVFSEIVSTKEKVISSDLDKKNKCRLLKNKNKLLKTLDGADGVKTGYTLKAGRCFVGSATRNGLQIICVVLNCRDMFEECTKFINKAFEEYSLICVQNKGEINNYENNLKTQNISKIIKKDIYLPLKTNEKDKLNFCYEIFDKPLSDGQIGFEYIMIENDLIFSEKIYTIIDEKHSKNNSFKDSFDKIIRAF